MNEITTTDGSLLYQIIDPLTKSLSPEFYNQFGHLGENTINLFIELKSVLTSNTTKRDDNIVNFFKKLDSQLHTLPTSTQNWFKKFYRTRIPLEIKSKITGGGELTSLDKTFRSKLPLVDSNQWYTANTIVPFDTLNQKVPFNMSLITKNANGVSVSNFAERQKMLFLMKERAKSAGIKEITTPDKAHGDVGFPVGDYLHPKRMGSIATEYKSKIMDMLGVNGKTFMENFNYKPGTTVIPSIGSLVSIFSKIGEKVLKTTIYGFVNKQVEAINPFLPKRKSE